MKKKNWLNLTFFCTCSKSSERVDTEVMQGPMSLKLRLTVSMLRSSVTVSS